MKYIYLVFIQFLCFSLFSQTFGWVKNPISGSDMESNRVITSDNGNYIVAGNYEGTVNFDGTNLFSYGNKDVFFTCYDSNGVMQWARSYGGFDDVEVSALHKGPNNTIYACGTFEGNVMFGTNTLVNFSDENGFVVKLDSSGNVIWAINVESSDDVNATDICVDSNGNAFFIGAFEGMVNVSTSSISSFGDKSIFIVSIDSNGVVQWLEEASSQDELDPLSIYISANNKLYLTGSFEGNMVFGSNLITNSSKQDMFVACMDNLGNFLWSQGVGGARDVSGQTIVADNNGNTYVGGHFEGSVIFSNATFFSSSGKDAFLVKYDLNGNLLWAKHFSGSGDVELIDMHPDSNFDLFLIGSIGATTIFDGQTINNSSGTDMFIVKFDTLGSVQWTKGIGGMNSVEGTGITTDASNNPIVTGMFDGTSYFDTITVSGVFNKTVFLGKVFTNNQITTIRDLIINQPELYIYPNPANGVLNIEINTNKQIKNSKWSIYTITGQEIKQIDFQSPRQTIHLDSYKKGSYIISNGFNSYKFIKQ